MIVLAYRRFVLGAGGQGVFTLFGILFFLLSVTMVGIGLIGEYVGRTYQVVRVAPALLRPRDARGEGLRRPRRPCPRPGYSSSATARSATTALISSSGAGTTWWPLITHEDNPGEKIWFKTPAIAARAKGVPVQTPAKVGTPEWLAQIAEMRPDLILSVYYRNMISTRILGLAPLGAFNMHGSLLPRYRGRAPINWAVLHGEPRIGMTLHRMVKEPDAGAIVDQEGVDIGPRDTAEQAFRKVLPCARHVLARQIDALLAGRAAETPQDPVARRRISEGAGPRTAASTGRSPRCGSSTWSGPSPIPIPGRSRTLGGSRLMVWWAEHESPAAHGGFGRPGEVITVSPLVVATGDGALELTRTEWRGGPAPAPQGRPGAPGVRFQRVSPRPVVRAAPGNCPGRVETGVAGAGGG